MAGEPSAEPGVDPRNEPGVHPRNEPSAGRGTRPSGDLSLEPGAGPEATRSAFVLTVSDGVAAGVRDDGSGAALAGRLGELGFAVARAAVPDEIEAIRAALGRAATEHPLVFTTGGTGLTPRDVTPQATAALLDYEVPGFAEAMRADGRARTPMAILSRGVVGVRGGSLIVNLPGSPKGALESLATLEPVLEHALETLAGPFAHAGWATDGSAAVRPGDPGAGSVESAPPAGLAGEPAT